MRNKVLNFIIVTSHTLVREIINRNGETLTVDFSNFYENEILKYLREKFESIELFSNYMLNYMRMLCENYYRISVNLYHCYLYEKGKSNVVVMFSLAN